MSAVSKDDVNKDRQLNPARKDLNVTHKNLDGQERQQGSYFEGLWSPEKKEL